MSKTAVSGLLRPIAFASFATFIASSASVAQTDLGDGSDAILEDTRAKLNAESHDDFVLLKPGTQKAVEIRNSKLSRLAELRGQIALAKKWAFLVGSLSHTLSVLAGVYDLASGANSIDLFIITSDIIPVGDSFGTASSTAPAGVTVVFGPNVYQQALMLDLTAPAVPFEVSHMAQSAIWTK